MKKYWPGIGWTNGARRFDSGYLSVATARYGLQVFGAVCMIAQRMSNLADAVRQCIIIVILIVPDTRNNLSPGYELTLLIRKAQQYVHRFRRYVSLRAVGRQANNSCGQVSL